MKVKSFEISKDIYEEQTYILYEIDSNKVWSIKGIIDQEEADNFSDNIQESCDDYLEKQESEKTVMNLMTDSLMSKEEQLDILKMTYAIIPIQGNITLYERIPIIDES